MRSLQAMSLTNNFDEKTGKEWQGTNISGLLIGHDKALDFVQEKTTHLSEDKGTGMESTW